MRLSLRRAAYVLIGLLVTGPLLGALRALDPDDGVVAAYAVIARICCSACRTTCSSPSTTSCASGSSRSAAALAILLARTRERLEWAARATR